MQHRRSRVYERASFTPAPQLWRIKSLCPRYATPFPLGFHNWFPPNVHFTQQSSKSMRAAERALAALLALAWAGSIHGTTVLSFTAPVRPKQPNTFIINWGEP